MVSDDVIKKTTENLLRKSFFNYFKAGQLETKHIIMDRLFPYERRITSTMSGFQTSLGTFWENLSLDLAQKNDLEIIDNSVLKMPEDIPKNLTRIIGDAKSKREINGGELDDFKERLNKEFPQAEPMQCDTKKMTKGKGSDLIVVKNGCHYIFDIKTVQVNANNGNTFNETIILWTAYYKYLKGLDAKKIKSMLVFPYSSSNEGDDSSWWAKFSGRISPLTEQDVFVGNEYWRFLTDNPDALNQIIAGIDNLKLDTQFMALYSQAFKVLNAAGLVEFSECVRLNHIQSKFSVELISPNQPWNLRTKFTWKHDDCSFKERLNKLLEAESYCCPECGIAL